MRPSIARTRVGRLFSIGISLFAFGLAFTCKPVLYPALSAHPAARVRLSHGLPINALANIAVPASTPTYKYISYNYSGYVVRTLNTGQQYTSVSSSWIVPGVSYASYSSQANGSCFPYLFGSCESSSVWGGIGAGDDLDPSTTVQDNTLIQVGTDQFINSSGDQAVFAFYETVPGNGPQLLTQLAACSPASMANCPVQPGDSIVALIKCTAPCTAYASSQTWSFLITDRTQGWTWSPPTLTFSSSLRSAEWIVEAACQASSCPDQKNISPMPYYAPVSFTALSANDANPQILPSTNGIVMNDPSGGGSTPSYPN